jgi:anti-anti-sigma factor
MDISEKKVGEILVLSPGGSLDTRNAMAFETRAVQLLDEGIDRVVIDFSEIDQLTSSGIRVLVMMVKRLAGIGGGLVLCSLNDPVRTIFDVSGLIEFFTIVPSRDKAIEELRTVPPKMSKVSRLADRLLGGRAKSRPSIMAKKNNRKERARSELSTKIARLISSSDTRSAEGKKVGRKKKTGARADEREPAGDQK